MTHLQHCPGTAGVSSTYLSVPAPSGDSAPQIMLERRSNPRRTNPSASARCPGGVSYAGRRPDFRNSGNGTDAIGHSESCGMNRFVLLKIENGISRRVRRHASFFQTLEQDRPAAFSGRFVSDVFVPSSIKTAGIFSGAI